MSGSVRPPLRAALRPSRGLDAWEPTLRSSALVVGSVAAATALSLVVTGLVLDAALPGTLTLPNPEHVSGSACDGRFAPAGCSEPATLTYDRGARAQAVLLAEALPAFFAVLVAWPLAAGAFYFLSGGTGVVFDYLLFEVAAGFVPALALAVARPALVWVAVARGVTPPDGPGFDAWVRALALGDASLLVVAAGVGVACWQAYVFARAVQAVREVRFRVAAFAVGLPTALLLAVEYWP